MIDMNLQLLLDLPSLDATTLSHAIADAAVSAESLAAHAAPTTVVRIFLLSQVTISVPTGLSQNSLQQALQHQACGSSATCVVSLSRRRLEVAFAQVHPTPPLLTNTPHFPTNIPPLLH